jgi:hypothetical protein
LFGSLSSLVIRLYVRLQLVSDVIELPDKKAKDFLVLIDLNQCFFEHAHMLFGEMTMKL